MRFVPQGLSEERVQSIQQAIRSWSDLAEQAESGAEAWEVRRSSIATRGESLVGWPNPAILRNQAAQYRQVVKSLELELSTGQSHCSCCLKPVGAGISFLQIRRG